MPGKLTFYTNPMSRGRMARWALEEVGMPYETVLLEYGTPMKAPEYLAINPMGKVPAIRHGETVVTECAAIITYLADAFPKSNLAPAAGSPGRGEFYRWMFYGAGPLEQASINKALGVKVPDDKRGMVGYGSLGLVARTLDEHLSTRDFLVGKAFSAADIYVGGQVGWLMGFGVIEKRPAFERYVERIGNRPAAIRAREIDDALIAKNKPKPVQT